MCSLDMVDAKLLQAAGDDSNGDDDERNNDFEDVQEQPGNPSTSKEGKLTFFQEYDKEDNTADVNNTNKN